MTPEEIASAAIDRLAAQKYTELVELVHLVARKRPKVVVEIGTMQGGTLFAWCQAADPDALIVSIDLPGGEWGGGYEANRADVIKTFAQPNQDLILIQGNSHADETRERLVDVMGGELGQVDFLFIDGDHTRDGARADFDDYLPFVRSGGLIAFHDILEHYEVVGCDVDLVWKSIRPSFRSWEFTQPGDERGYGQWGGIGVIEIP